MKTLFKMVFNLKIFSYIKFNMRKKFKMRY